MRRAIVILLALSSAGCSLIFDPAGLRGDASAPAIDGGADAGIDAGALDAGAADAGPDVRPDAGMDAGPDGGIDAGSADAGPTDAGADAGFDAGCALAPAPSTMECGFPAIGTRLASAEITECAGGASDVDSSWWLAWRFQAPAGATEITAVGFHGLHTGEVFGGLVSLSGPTGAPGAPPPMMAFRKLAGCALMSIGAQDVQFGFDAPVGVIGGSWYAVIIGTDRYGVGPGTAQITRSTVPRDPGMFDIEVGVGTNPHAFAARLFVDYR